MHAVSVSWRPTPPQSCQHNHWDARGDYCGAQLWGRGGGICTRTTKKKGKNSDGFCQSRNSVPLTVTALYMRIDERCQGALVQCDALGSSTSYMQTGKQETKQTGLVKCRGIGREKRGRHEGDTKTWNDEVSNILANCSTGSPHPIMAKKKNAEKMSRSGEKLVEIGYTSVQSRAPPFRLTCSAFFSYPCDRRGRDEDMNDGFVWCFENNKPHSSGCEMYFT